MKEQNRLPGNFSLGYVKLKPAELVGSSIPLDSTLIVLEPSRSEMLRNRAYLRRTGHLFLVALDVDTPNLDIFL